MSRAPVLLITGANGFVGRQVLAALPDDMEIHAVSRHQIESDRPEIWHQVNLLDQTQCRALIEHVRPTHLVHLAWTTRPGLFWNDPANHSWRDAGMVLLEAFGRAGGARAIIGGTCAEYPPNAATPLREDAARLDPGSVYGASKKALHHATLELAKDYDFDMAWARIFTPYGVGEAMEKLIPSLINSILDRKTVPCSSGRQLRDFMDVRDLGAALAALTLADIVGAINLGSGETRSVADVARRVGDLMSSPDLITIGGLPDRENDPVALVPIWRV